MVEPSTRAKWRALRSARSSTLKKGLTAPTLSETRCYANHSSSVNWVAGSIRTVHKHGAQEARHPYPRGVPRYSDRIRPAAESRVEKQFQVSNTASFGHA